MWFILFLWKWKSLNHVWLFATPWTTQSMEFSRPEYCSGQPFPSPGGSSQPRDWTQVSHITGTFFTSWARRTRTIRECVAYPFCKVDLPDPGIELGSPALQAHSLPTELRGKSSVYLMLLIFLPTILIPTCDSSSSAFHMMNSAYKSNEQVFRVGCCN